MNRAKPANCHPFSLSNSALILSSFGRVATLNRDSFPSFL